MNRRIDRVDIVRDIETSRFHPDNEGLLDLACKAWIHLVRMIPAANQSCLGNSRDVGHFYPVFKALKSKIINSLIGNRFWAFGALARSPKPEACVSMGADWQQGASKSSAAAGGVGARPRFPRWDLSPALAKLVLLRSRQWL
jgi:hypothetical protein